MSSPIKAPVHEDGNVVLPSNQTVAEERPQLLGSSVQVPLISGQRRRYVNLDYAASTPPLTAVVRTIKSFLPYYSSVHRGAGYKSQVSTAAYEGARRAVHAFFQARPSDTVIFTRNTTDAINLLADALSDEATVVAFASEHHANLLPWRKGKHNVTYLPSPQSADEAIASLVSHLRAHRTDLVAITGASNVTGEVWPAAELAAIAHASGARLLLDAAQLAPHSPISISDLQIDYLAASGHKLYAPFGAGVLIGRPDWLEQAEPYMRGGGAVDFVTSEEVLWTELPDRQEAGSPNVVGALALGVASQVLAQYGMERIAAEERQLARYMREAMRSVPGIDVYRLWDEDADRIGVATFNVQGYDHSQLATVLSAEYGIGVRHGCFCAHPLMLTLLQVDTGSAADIRDAFRRGTRPRVPGAVRASIGLGTTREEIDYLIESLNTLVTEGPRWTYARDQRTGDFRPTPDPRPWPHITFLSLQEPANWSESS